MKKVLAYAATAVLLAAVLAHVFSVLYFKHQHRSMPAEAKSCVASAESLINATKTKVSQEEPEYYKTAYIEVKLETSLYLHSAAAHNMDLLVLRQQSENISWVHPIENAKNYLLARQTFKAVKDAAIQIEQTCHEIESALGEEFICEQYGVEAYLQKTDILKTWRLIRNRTIFYMEQQKHIVDNLQAVHTECSQSDPNMVLQFGPAFYDKWEAAQKQSRILLLIVDDFAYLYSRLLRSEEDTFICGMHLFKTAHKVFQSFKAIAAAQAEAALQLEEARAALKKASSS